MKLKLNIPLRIMKWCRTAGATQLDWNSLNIIAPWCLARFLVRWRRAVSSSWKCQSSSLVLGLAVAAGCCFIHRSREQRRNCHHWAINYGYFYQFIARQSGFYSIRGLIVPGWCLIRDPLRSADSAALGNTSTGQYRQSGSTTRWDTTLKITSNNTT